MHDVTSAKHTKTIIVETKFNKKCLNGIAYRHKNFKFSVKAVTTLQLFPLELVSFIFAVDAAHNPVSVSTLAASTT